MATVVSSVTDLCLAAKAAARPLAAVPSVVKDRALHAIADALEGRVDEILEANAREVRKVRVPLGVVAVVYEARPNVTIDAAALCLKSGNAVLLRGSSSAAHSNAVLAGVARDAAETAGLPEGALALVAGGGREELAELATQNEFVDLIIPRGGEGLKKALSAVATVPVIYAASGNCHVYVDEEADLDDALAIIVNAKTQRPGVCNAAETMLVHASVAPAFLARALPPRTTSPPSSSHSCWRSGWSTRSRTRSPTSTASAPGTRSRSSPAAPPPRAR